MFITMMRSHESGIDFRFSLLNVDMSENRLTDGDGTVASELKV